MERFIPMAPGKSQTFVETVPGRHAEAFVETKLGDEFLKPAYDRVINKALNHLLQGLDEGSAVATKKAAQNLLANPLSVPLDHNHIENDEERQAWDLASVILFYNKNVSFLTPDDKRAIQQYMDFLMKKRSDKQVS